MIILGIDFGLKNIGLAIAAGPLAEPMTNLKFSPKIYERLCQICLKLRVELVVVGVSEGKMAQKSEKFVENLRSKLDVPVVMQDETLTTQQAIRKLYEAKRKKKKRRGPKHAYAATLILQDYLNRTKERED